MNDQTSFQSYMLSPFKSENVKDVWDMRNSGFVREAMINSDPIPYEVHEKWFSRILNSNDCRYYLCTYEAEPVGVVGFFNIENNTADWSFYLKDALQPKGLGSYMCKIALDETFKSTPVNTIKTKVLIDNKASIHLHKKLGFKNLENEGGKDFYVLELQKHEWLINPAF